MFRARALLVATLLLQGLQPSLALPGAAVACPAGTQLQQGKDGAEASCAVRCPEGQYSSGPDSCAACAAVAGAYCPEGSTYAAGWVCPAGFTCEGGSAPAVAAPPGFFATGGATRSWLIACPPGTSSNVTGLTSAKGCIACE